MLGRFDEARAHVAASSEVFRQLGQQRWLADAMSQSGLIARLEGRLDDAERQLRESYRSFDDQHDSANAPTIACELGQVLCELHRYEEASELSRYAEDQAVSHDLEPQVGWRCVRARAMAGLGSAHQGEGFAREALDLVASTDFLGLHADVLATLGDVLRLAGRADEAAVALTQAIERYERKGNLAASRRAETLLSRPT
jgi:tetratricopeptide (TPR) repeat protein